MQRTVTALLSVWATIAMASSAVTPARAGSVGDLLKERYQLSQIDMQNQAIEGRVSCPGSVFTLRADQVPANRLRTVQINTKSPRFHVRDYARVDVAPDGTLSGKPGDFSLSRGTRLVVLDVEVESDRIRVFAHTLSPAQVLAGKAAYGCTEFVFHVDPAVIARGDVAEIERRIEQVIPVVSAG